MSVVLAVLKLCRGWAVLVMCGILVSGAGMGVMTVLGSPTWVAIVYRQAGVCRCNRVWFDQTAVFCGVASLVAFRVNSTTMQGPCHKVKTPSGHARSLTTFCHALPVIPSRCAGRLGLMLLRRSWRGSMQQPAQQVQPTAATLQLLQMPLRGLRV